jgi:hypothetical protein
MFERGLRTTGSSFAGTPRGTSSCRPPRAASRRPSSSCRRTWTWCASVARTAPTIPPRAGSSWSARAIGSPPTGRRAARTRRRNRGDHGVGRGRVATARPAGTAGDGGRGARGPGEGASGLDPSFVSGTALLNLDNEEDGKLTSALREHRHIDSDRAAAGEVCGGRGHVGGPSAAGLAGTQAPTSPPAARTRSRCWDARSARHSPRRRSGSSQCRAARAGMPFLATPPRSACCRPGERRDSVPPSRAPPRRSGTLREDRPGRHGDGHRRAAAADARGFGRWILDERGILAGSSA